LSSHRYIVLDVNVIRVYPKRLNLPLTFAKLDNILGRHVRAYWVKEKKNKRSRYCRELP